MRRARSLPAAAIVPVVMDGASKGTYALMAYIGAVGRAGAVTAPANGASTNWPACVRIVESAQALAGFLQATPNAVA